MTAPQLSYRRDIDGLRGLSIFLVLAFHGFSQVVPGGYIGVDVFFVISGYLITNQIYSQVKLGSFSIIGFYARRIRRIFPPLITVLFIAGLYGYFRLSLDGLNSLFEHIASGSSFTSNFLLWRESGYFDKQAELKPLLHLWSLAIEEQFYVIWPILLIVLMAMERRYRCAIACGVLVLCIVSFFVGVHLTGSNSIAAFYSPLSRLWELGIGGFLAMLESSGVGIRRFNLSDRMKDMCAVIGLGCIVACAFLLSKESKFPGILAALPTISALVIIAAGPSSIINRRLFSSYPMVQLGLISYSLYLWHWPLLSFMRIEGLGGDLVTCLILIIGIVLAMVTRFIVENPIRYSALRSMPVWLALVITLIGVIGFLGAQGHLLPERLHSQVQIKLANQFSSQGIPSRSCEKLAKHDSLAFRFCTIWGTNEAKRSIVVWGDSMSNAWMPPFLSLAREHDFRVIQFSHAACPAIIGVHRTGDSFAKEWCNETTLQAQVLEAIELEKPEFVFLISRWNLYYHGYIKDNALVEKSFITDEPYEATPITARIAFERGIPRTVGMLSTFSRVVIFKDTPVLKVPIDVGLTHRPDHFEPSATEQAAFEAGINRVIDAAILRTPGALVFDPTLRLCDMNKCSGFVNGIPAYSDDAHITAQAALLFTTDIKRIVGVVK